MGGEAPRSTEFLFTGNRGRTKLFFGDIEKLSVLFFAGRHLPNADWPNFGNALISMPKLHSKINLPEIFQRHWIRRILF